MSATRASATSAKADKAGGKAPSSRGKGKAKAKEESDDELAEPTGLTSDESNSGSGSESSELSDASDFEPEPEGDDDDPEAISVISVSDDESDAPPRKKARSSLAKNQKQKRPVKSEKHAGPGHLEVKVVNGRRVTALGEELDDDSDYDLEDGQEVVGRIYPAPRSGRGGSTGGCLAALGRLGQAATREAYLG